MNSSVELELLALLPSEDIGVITIILVVFFFAGVIKGFLGIGLPAAAMAILTLVIEPTIAISLLTLPIIFTNSIQYASCKSPRIIAAKYWLFGVAIMVSIFVTSLFILSFPSAFLTISIGFAMITFSLTQMFGAHMPIGPGRSWHVAVGLFSGLLGPKFNLVTTGSDVCSRRTCQRMIHWRNRFFVSGRVNSTATGLAFAGVLTLTTTLHSLMGLVVVLIGFKFGEWLRGYVPQSIFRQIVLWAFLLMGGRLIAVGMF